MTDGPVFHVEPQGQLGNRMIQYMVALKFRDLMPDTRISNVHLPEWRIEHPPIESPEQAETVGRGHHIDLAGLAARVRAGEIRRIVFPGWGQRLENFLPLDVYRSVFRPTPANPPEFDSRHLLCPVRAGDILHSGLFYPLTPVEFYADVVAQTGLVPVFMGQTEPNRYTDRLRERFPTAIFLDTRGPLGDFALIRSAKNIVVGVSTFIWLAAWLSEADHIFMAVSGLFNHMQYPAADLLPFNDPRYRFWLFPINYGVPLELHAAAHRRIAPLWRQVSHPALRQMLLQAPRFDTPLEALLAEFDPAFYLKAHPDIAALLGSDNHEAARQHYAQHGHRQSRAPFPMDPIWYSLRYPIAAFEQSQGDYASFFHHFAAVGRRRGYRPLPDPQRPWQWEDDRAG